MKDEELDCAVISDEGSSSFILDSSFLRILTRILSRLPLAMITVIPSSATLRAILVLVSIPPRPKLDLEVCMYEDRSLPCSISRMTSDEGSAGEPL